MSYREIVTRVAALIDQHYVDPPTAARMADALRSRPEPAAAAVGPGPDGERRLCRALTDELRRISGDHHLAVRISEDPGDEQGWLLRMRDGFVRENHGFARVEWLDGRVGLLELTAFSEPAWAGERAVAAMTLLADADALIVDVRRNHGGAPAMVALLTSYLVDRPTLLNTMRSRDPAFAEQSWTLPWVPGPRFGGSRPIWVLTSRRTFSGGEEFAYNLQTLGRATVVGEVTAGAAHPLTVHPVTSTVEICMPYRRPVNPVTGTNWQGDGVVPDIAVPADTALDVAHQRALDRRADRSPVGGS